MGFHRNVSPSLIAGGNINPASFVMPSTVADNTGLQCTANTLPIGISDVGTDTPPGVVGSGTLNAKATEPISLFALGDVCNLTAGSGGWTQGQFLKSDASGNGIPVATSGVAQAVGARALETTPAGQQGLVQVMSFWYDPDQVLANGVVTVTYTWNGTNLALTGSFWTASRAYLITDIRGYVDILGTNGSAVTGQIATAPSGTAISAGTVMHSGTFNLKGTISTTQVLTLTGSQAVAAGTSLGFILTGTATTAQGSITVTLAPQ
jgi:hypothetical protein